MIVVRSFTNAKWKEHQQNYKHTASAVLIFNESPNDGLHVTFNKLKHKWSRDIIVKIGYYLMDLGLRGVTIKLNIASPSCPSELLLHGTSIILNKNNLLLIQNFSNLGITKDELVEYITKQTEIFIERRGIKC